MNILKNMELIFLVAVVLAGITTLASASMPVAHAPAKAALARGDIQVVTITARRLTAAEKAQ